MHRKTEIGFKKTKKTGSTRQVTDVTAVEYIKSNGHKIRGILRRPVIEHFTNRTRTKQAKSQTKIRQEKHTETILSFIVRHCTKALSDNTSLVTTRSFYRKCVSKNDVPIQKSDNSPAIRSRTVMNEVDPSLQLHPSLLTQLLHCILECPSRSFMVQHSILVGLVRENCLVEMLR